MSILLEILQASLPQGVHMCVDAHSEEAENVSINFATIKTIHINEMCFKLLLCSCRH